MSPYDCGGQRAALTTQESVLSFRHVGQDLGIGLRLSALEARTLVQGLAHPTTAFSFA